MGKIVYGRFLKELERDQAAVEDWNDIPSRLRHWAVLWRDGQDVRGMMSRASFYRTRVKLLEFGIDLSCEANVVALSSRRRTVEVSQRCAFREAA